jgi:hypothetical protein
VQRTIDVDTILFKPEQLTLEIMLGKQAKLLLAQYCSIRLDDNVGEASSIAVDAILLKPTN